MSDPIVQRTHPALRTPAQEVSEDMFNTPKLEDILQRMEAALHKEPAGVALAANQIALPYKIFIVRYDRLDPNYRPGEDDTPDVGVYINPEIIKHSRKQMKIEEACLSVHTDDGKLLLGDVERFEQVTVRAQDQYGETFTRGAGGILSQAFQHEIDHLNGTLFIDHVDTLYELQEPDHA